MRTQIVVFFLPILIFISALSDVSATEQNSRTYEVIVVGGGIAGLTAAYYLDDYDLLLLEKEHKVGGRALSGQYRGISYAKGAEYLGTPEEPLSEIIKKLNLDLREIPAPTDIIYRDGKMFFGDYGKADLMISGSSLREFNRFAAKVLEEYERYDDIPDLALDKEIRQLDNITARQWFEVNRFPPLYIEIYNVAFRGLFGANIDEISALSAFPEMAFDFEGFERIDDVDDLAEEFADDGDSTGMYSFDDGIAEIPLALASYLGNRVRTNSMVTAVEREGDFFVVKCIQEGNKIVAYRSEAVVLATPAAVTLHIAGKVLSTEQQQVLRHVRYAPYITIALFSDTQVFNKGFDLAVPDGLLFTDIYDATWISRHNKSSSPDKQQGWVTLIYAAPQSFRDTTLLKMPDRDLINTVLQQLDNILPGASKHIKGWDITRFRFGYPVMVPGSYQKMTRLRSITGNGLFLAGDYLIYPTFEAAAASGQLAAKEVEDWLED